MPHAHKYSFHELFILMMLGTFPFLLTGCSGPSYTQVAASYPPPPSSTLRPDYNLLYYWAAHPYKHDPSDSTPAPYLPVDIDSSVDVFFVHPTTFTDEVEIEGKPYTNEYWNASLDNNNLNAKTDYTTILNQASVFNTYRVFAPRYRQAHIRSFYIPDSLSRPFFDTAFADVLAAFQHYLHAYNNGRPFIIASHSQGTRHAARLILEYIEGTPLAHYLVAAYIIGLPVPVDYFKQTPPCTLPGQTGCFVGWRTYKKGYIPKAILQETFTAFNVNPLTFDTSRSKASRMENKGAVLYKFNKPKAHNVSTIVNGNVLWSSKPRFFGNLFFNEKNYHIGDINLFWKDIRDNAAIRISEWRKKQGTY